MVSETTAMVLVKGHNARWPLTSLHCWRSWTHSRPRRSMTGSRQAAQTIYQALIEAQLTAVIGAAPHERTPDRLAQRNGHRPRVLTTTAGDLELRIPKLRAGSFFPSLLERRRRV